MVMDLRMENRDRAKPGLYNAILTHSVSNHNLITYINVGRLIKPYYNYIYIHTHLSNSDLILAPCPSRSICSPVPICPVFPALLLVAVLIDRRSSHFMNCPSTCMYMCVCVQIESDCHRKVGNFISVWYNYGNCIVLKFGWMVQ